MKKYIILMLIWAISILGLGVACMYEPHLLDIPKKIMERIEEEQQKEVIEKQIEVNDEQNKTQ